jgi:hypothetical protein
MGWKTLTGLGLVGAGLLAHSYQQYTQGFEPPRLPLRADSVIAYQLSVDALRRTRSSMQEFTSSGDQNFLLRLTNPDSSRSSLLFGPGAAAQFRDEQKSQPDQDGLYVMYEDDTLTYDFLDSGLSGNLQGARATRRHGGHWVHDSLTPENRERFQKAYWYTVLTLTDKLRAYADTVESREQNRKHE